MKPLTILLPALLLLSSCNRFYAPVKSTEGPVDDAIKKYLGEARTFILHDSSFTYIMANMTMEKDIIKSLLLRRESLKSKYHSSQSHLNYHYKFRRTDSSVVNQIHLFTFRALTRGENVEMTIPLSDVMDVQVLKFDKAKTTERRIIGVLAAVVTIGTVIMIAGLYTFSNSF